METLGRANFKVTYNKKDISSDLVPFLRSIRYKDNAEGKADELELSLENVDAFWENEWYPEKGDTIECEIGYEALMNCGTFEVDEIEITSIPDVVTIKAISAAISGNTRTKKSVAHENTTLKEIVQKVAADNGYTVTGEIADITFTRITQKREHDLEFLRRLSNQYGYFFSIRGSQLVFTNLYAIMGSESVKVIDREDCKSYTIKDKSAKVFRKANLRYFDSKQGKVTEIVFTPESIKNSDGLEYNTITDEQISQGVSPIPTPLGITARPNILFQTEEYELQQDAGLNFNLSPTDDTLMLNDRVENDGQAEAVAKAGLIRANTCQQEGSITLVGDPVMVAGNNFQFTGIGKLSGKYHIAESEHSIDSAGYITTVEIKRVGFIELVKGKRKRNPARKNYEVKVVQ